MKSEKLLEIIGEAKETYVLSALDSRNRKKTSPKRIALGRAVLIAAIIAMMLLLVGCTVAYILSLHEKKVGESTGTIYFDEDGQRIPPTEISQDVISLFGYRGSPYYQASAEWYEFKKTYDPDRSLFPHDATALEFDAFYFDTYDCYTPEMVSELNEVATKY